MDWPMGNWLIILGQINITHQSLTEIVFSAAYPVIFVPSILEGNSYLPPHIGQSSYSISATARWFCRFGIFSGDAS